MTKEDLKRIGITKDPDFHNIVIVLLCVIAFLSIALIGGCLKEARAEVITSTAIIHHSASPDMSAKVIDTYHRSKGWSGIGYHFVIRANGQIEKGRPLTKKGAHAKGRNQYVGICLTGKDYFTPAQLKSLTKLLNDLGTQKVERHHEQCPGRGLDLIKIAQTLKKQIYLARRY